VLANHSVKDCITQTNNSSVNVELNHSFETHDVNINKVSKVRENKTNNLSHTHVQGNITFSSPVKIIVFADSHGKILSKMVSVQKHVENFFWVKPGAKFSAICNSLLKTV